MPCCVFHASGEEFDVDSFLATSSLRPFAVHHRGERSFPSRPPEPCSGFKVDVADCDGCLAEQVEEATRFLQENYCDLVRLCSLPQVTNRRLDFGYYFNLDSFVQSELLPLELLRLAGVLQIEIELSLYPR